MRVIVALALLIATLCPADTLAQSDEMHDDLIHSDLPIFLGGEAQWPQSVSDGDSFGCASRVAFGDWVFRYGAADAKPALSDSWYRFSNYGVIHCWANIGEANDREGLSSASSRPSLFIYLETRAVEGKDVELWAIQLGARPGSDYLLLSRAPAEGLVISFSVLQTECPSAHRRDAGPIDILRTDYCGIDSRKELIRLARRMAARTPLGTLSVVPGVNE